MVCILRSYCKVKKNPRICFQLSFSNHNSAQVGTPSMYYFLRRNMVSGPFASYTCFRIPSTGKPCSPKAAPLFAPKFLGAKLTPALLLGGVFLLWLEETIKLSRCTEPIVIDHLFVRIRSEGSVRPFRLYANLLPQIELWIWIIITYDVM